MFRQDQKLFSEPSPEGSSSSRDSAEAQQPSSETTPSKLESLLQDGKGEYYLSGAITRLRPLTPNKDLQESAKHGTSLFPCAFYNWENQSTSFKVALHWHKEVELVRFYAGSSFDISVDMYDYTVNEDAFLLIPSNVMHSFTLPVGCRESALVFDPQMLILQNYDAVESDVMSAMVQGHIALPPLIFKQNPIFDEVDRLYQNCAGRMLDPSAADKLMMKAHLLEIMALYYERGLLNRKNTVSHEKKNKQNRLKNLLAYIDAHYAGPITISDAAKRLGVTDQYFCRFFKRVTDMSFTEYLNDLRLRRAARELELTTRSITDIASEHGFENAGYFFKSFKNKFAMTPLKFRKQYLANGGVSVATVSMPRNTVEIYPTPEPKKKVRRKKKESLVIDTTDPKNKELIAHIEQQKILSTGTVVKLEEQTPLEETKPKAKAKARTTKAQAKEEKGRKGQDVL